MLSVDQISLRGRRWGRVTAANDWRMVKGRLACDRRLNEQRSAEHAAIWDLADLRARTHHASIVVEDLWRATTALAFIQSAGYRGVRVSPLVELERSGREMNQLQFGLLLRLIGDNRDVAGLLIDPNCLNSRLDWDHPINIEVSNAVVWIERHCVQGYPGKLCSAIYGTSDWRSLAAKELLKLCRLLRDRPSSRLAAGESRRTEVEVPF